MDHRGRQAVGGAQALCGHLGLTLDEFLGDYAAAGYALIDALASEITRRVRLRLARASEVWAQQYGDLTPKARAEALAMIDVLTLVDEDARRIAHPCPACKQTGLLEGDAVPYADVDGGIIDDEPWAQITHAEMQLHARAFRCPFCSLRLTGPTDLQEAGLPGETVIREATPEDLENFWADIELGSNNLP